MELPNLPVAIDQFLEHTKNFATQAELQQATEPFKVYETKLREIFAQYPGDVASLKNHLVPVFDAGKCNAAVRARDLGAEPVEVKDRYLLPIADKMRRKHGSSAIVKTFAEFKTNFNLFSESSLVDLDWTNVVACGSSVATAMLPVDTPHNESKRALRAYYHQTLAPASDVDLFLYGLNEEEAIAKIKQIETKIRDSILSEVTVIRTKNAITIASEYPTRHVQIVLRLYKSVSEILTGFDVDCSCVAYDGSQAWATPRALTAYMTQVNTIDLSRRSPSYENRLSKYSHRGFEVYWPALKRSLIDPTIFERSFSRVLGLARLLVLEKLPHPNDRDSYLAKRREERGRPPLPWNARYRHQLPGNVKDAQPDDVAEWVESDDISSYTTFVIPYGPKHNAKKIEKLLFTKDLLLNSEWNRPKDRDTKLHRHPAFFGAVEDVINDCCGFCPIPKTDEDLKYHEEESKIYISGDMTFMKDDPGRQAIGSFNPITDEDWTEMAYIGNTTRLCQAIVDKDLEAVEDWFSSGDPDEVLNVNQRDHAGRTPLLLATMSSSPEIVQCLIEHGARLVSRLYNGLTALHIAAYRGEAEMVQLILDRSELNREGEDRKEDVRKIARREAVPQVDDSMKIDEVTDSEPHGVDNDPYSDIKGDSNDDSDENGDGTDDDVTEESFVKVSDQDRYNAPEDNDDEPDVYDVDVLAWDQPMSPLHLAIIAGRKDVISLLISRYAADVLLPIKIINKDGERDPDTAILTLILALEAPLTTAKETVAALLGAGGTVTQADAGERSALHFAIASAKAIIINTMAAAASPEVLDRTINHVSFSSTRWYQKSVEAPLLTAVRTRRQEIVDMALKMGARPQIDEGAFLKAFARNEPNDRSNPEELSKKFNKMVEQPVILAARLELAGIVERLLDAGADCNTLPAHAYAWLDGETWNSCNQSLLDIIRDRIAALEQAITPQSTVEVEAPQTLGDDKEYLYETTHDYRSWMAVHDLHQARIVKQHQVKEFESETARFQPQEEGSEERKAALTAVLGQMKDLERKIVEMGGRTFYELHPDSRKPQNSDWNQGHNTGSWNDKPYVTRLTFNQAGLSVEQKNSYIELFEAAWTGDTKRVKELCLRAEDPLHVTVEDGAGFSPFSIAVLRGHEQLASTLIEIATVQYQPAKDQPKFHYRLLGAEESGENQDSDIDDSQQDDDHPPILRELLREKFTVDDVTALSANVKSKVSPLAMLNRKSGVWRTSGATLMDDKLREFQLLSDNVFYSAFVYGDRTQRSWAWFNLALPQEYARCSQTLVRCAIVKNDLRMLRFLLKCGVELIARQDSDDETKSYRIADQDFTAAIRLGRTELLSEIIATTGQAMPLDKMVESSGLKLDEKPKYYQGLTVHGSKRRDWADRAQGKTCVIEQTEEAPLLKAIFHGNLRSAEYYMSDSPLNRYGEFSKAHKTDKRIERLASVGGGIDTALDSWLRTRANLALHMAVMAPPGEDDAQLIEYISKTMPDTIEVKSSSHGMTPLHLALTLSRLRVAKILIAAGADQRTRDDEGSNILHTIFQNNQLMEPALLPSILAMLDPKSIQEMLMEKSSKPEPGSMTPLAAFLSQFSTDVNVIPLLRIILERSQAKDLASMNGAGDYPLHTLVRNGNMKLVNFITQYQPNLLCYENATGMTPIDVAETKKLRGIIDNPPKIPKPNGSYYNNVERWSIADKPARDFAAKAVDRELEDCYKVMALEPDDLDPNRDDDWNMHRLVNKLAETYPRKRKLVSVFDANEVAKRLALRQQKINEETRRQERLGLNVTGMKSRERWGQGESWDEVRKRYRRIRRNNRQRYQDEYGNWVFPDDEWDDEVDRWLNIAQSYEKKDLAEWKEEVEKKAKEDAD